MSRQALSRVALAVAILLQLVAGTITVASAPGGMATAHTTPTSPALSRDPSAQAGLPPALDKSRQRVAVQQLLDRWGAAVRSQDMATLSSLFDPRADQGFLAKERTRSSNLAGVPLADWGYRIGSDPTPTVPPAVRVHVDADEVWSPPVELHYAIAGADPAPTTRPVGLVVARRGTVWRLVSDTAEDDYGRQTWRGPWDFGPIITRTVDRGVVLGHPAHSADADALAADLDAAVTAVAEVWGPDWPQRAAVFLPDTEEEMKALVGPNFSSAGIAAVSIADDIDRERKVARGQRVVFNPATIDKLTALSRQVVLRHELTHVATRVQTAPQVPMWLAEGFADYCGYRGSGVSLAEGAPAVAALVRSVGPPDSLPTNDQFGAGPTPERAELAYQLAWTFASFIATDKGEQNLVAMYRAVAALPAPSVADIDKALLPVLDTNLASLIHEWGDWLERTLH